MMDERRKALVNAYLTGCNFRRFKYGQWDCALFCADVLQCLTGCDLAAGLRGSYASKEGYEAALPLGLRHVPEYFGLTPATAVDGAVFWMPGAEGGQGGLGVVWQGKFLQPWKRGIREVTADASTLEFYSLI